MRRHTALGNLVLACALVFGAAFSCGGPNNNRGGSTQTNESGSDLSDLPGTHWSLLALTTKSETEKQTGTWPNVQFCKDGTWAILHYGSMQGGRYQVDGRRLVMKSENGALYGDYRVSSRTGSDLVLESDEYLMHLRYLDSADCSR